MTPPSPSHPRAPRRWRASSSTTAVYSWAPEPPRCWEITALGPTTRYRRGAPLAPMGAFRVSLGDRGGEGRLEGRGRPNHTLPTGGTARSYGGLSGKLRHGACPSIFMPPSVSTRFTSPSIRPPCIHKPHSSPPTLFTFLRVRTWMRIDDSLAASTMIADARALGEMEGLPPPVFPPIFTSPTLSPPQYSPSSAFVLGCASTTLSPPPR
jgi:hypothetical protein